MTRNSNRIRKIEFENSKSDNWNWKHCVQRVHDTYRYINLLYISATAIGCTEQAYNILISYDYDDKMILYK